MELNQNRDFSTLEGCYIDMEKTGEHIKRLVRENSLNAHLLSLRLDGVSEQAIYKWFRGKSLPSIDNMIRLKQVLGLETIDELIIIAGSATEGLQLSKPQVD